MKEPILFNSYSPFPYNTFSNFWMSSFIYKGVLYNSVEHGYQAGKCKSTREAFLIRTEPTAQAAKKAGKLIQVRADWEEIKIPLMKELLRCKFLQNDSLRQLLMQTDNTELIHSTPWGDELWGNGKKGNGQNILGKQLMEIREEFFKPVKHQ